MIDLNRIKIRRPATAKTFPCDMTASVNSIKTCSFAYDCLETDMDETGLCSIHSERLQALVTSNPKLTGIFPSQTSFHDLEWPLPQGRPAVVGDFMKILQYIRSMIRATLSV
jgi:hypothetical protein